MTRANTVQIVVLVVFSVNAILLITLIMLKTLHRAHMERSERRKAGYIALLSRHLIFDNCTDHIDRRATTQRAFLDALIDVRNAITGPEVEALRGIVHRYGVMDALGAIAQKRWPRGRRLRHAVALAELGDESSARVLMKLVDDRDPEIRVQAARGLGRMKWTPAIDAILHRLEMEEPWVRSRFADTLITFGGKATWPLAAYMKINHRHDPDGTVAVMQALAAIGDEQATIPILDVLADDPNPEVAISAVETLGQLGGPLAIAPLQESARSGDWRIRAKAVTALGSMGDPQARPVLTETITDSNFWVRRNSAAALARIPGGTEALLDVIEGDDHYASDAAIEALADRGDLNAARHRVQDGIASEFDYRLLAFVDEDERVAS